MELVNWVKTLDEAVCVSLYFNVLRTSVLVPTIGKYYRKLGSLAVIWQPV